MDDAAAMNRSQRINMDQHPQELLFLKQKHKVFPAPDTIAPDVPVAGTICAVVVAFFPDQTFGERLSSLLPQVGMVLVVDNTPAEGRAHQIKALFEADAHVCVIENQTNMGISVALNQGLDFALEQGCNWVLTLDQDTQCRPDMVQALLQVYAACEPKPAVIGGNYLDPRDGHLKVPMGEAGDFLEQKTVITSGSLIDASMARSIGGFREDYFIDQVDHEFCLRVRCYGRQVVISRKPVMEHSVGSHGGVGLPVFGILPNHSPLRKYYITRNTLIIVSTYWRQEPAWCLRRMVRLLLGLGSMALLEKHRLAKVCAFVAGAVDAIRQRMGPCRWEWLYRSW